MEPTNNNPPANSNTLTVTEKIIVGGIGIVTPLISLVALPIFSCYYIYQSIKHSHLYNKTLNNQKLRQEFGLKVSQDYTQYDGKSIVRITPSDIAAFQKHRSEDSFPYNKVEIEREEYPFNTKQDREWLGHEMNRLKIKQEMKVTAHKIVTCLIALIPIFGLLWTLDRAKTGEVEANCLICKIPKIEHSSGYEAVSHHIVQMQKFGFI